MVALMIPLKFYSPPCCAQIMRRTFVECSPTISARLTPGHSVRRGDQATRPQVLLWTAQMARATLRMLRPQAITHTKGLMCSSRERLFCATLGTTPYRSGTTCEMLHLLSIFILLIYSSPPAHLSFFVFRFGNDMGTLRVDAFNVSTSRWSEGIWIQTGNQGNVWHNATASLTLSNSKVGHAKNK